MESNDTGWSSRVLSAPIWEMVHFLKYLLMYLILQVRHIEHFLQSGFSKHMKVSNIGSPFYSFFLLSI